MSVEAIEALARDFPDWISLREEGRAGAAPIYSLQIGDEPPSKDVPTFGIFAGVHGLERIGVELALYFLRSLCEQLRWDRPLRERLKTCRVVSIPLVNPGGFNAHTRSNPNGVDLMRNAPIEAQGSVPGIAGGHRISPRLPWYRGKAGAPLEGETQVVFDFVRREIFPSRVATVLDLHSGFGIRDRLWHPFATTHAPFPLQKQVNQLVSTFEKAYPHHIYKIEPTSQSYLIHGDLWDYLYFEHAREKPNALFIPWTLEMGSWLWVKKNPFQAFSRFGIYHPVKPHRFRRVMRRHQALLDFFWRITAEPSAWEPVK